MQDRLLQWHTRQHSAVWFEPTLLCYTVQAVMAIGDGGNDLPLLKSAGLGIAMGNAVPEVSMLYAWVIAVLCKPDVNISTPLADLLKCVCIGHITSVFKKQLH